jgi:hypothetical protein
MNGKLCTTSLSNTKRGYHPAGILNDPPLNKDALTPLLRRKNMGYNETPTTKENS